MKRSVAIYSDTYLTISMTFIYRQLMYNGSNPKIVCTKKIENMDIFPYDKVFYPNIKRSILKKAVNKIDKILKGDYIYSYKDEEQYFIDRLSKNNAGLIHAHFGPGGIRMCEVKKALNIPLITTFHGYDLSSLLNEKSYINQLKVLFKEGDLFISVSEYFKKTLVSLGCPPEKVMTHYIGIPIEEYSFRKRQLKVDTVRLIQVSNMVPKKGHIYLLQGFKKLLSTMDNVELVLVGDGPERESIESMIKTLGLSGKVRLMGKLKSALALQEMDKSDIFVHHSVTGPDGDTEGIPTVLMEAMSLGLPVISTYHTGIPELVRHGENGLLTHEKDTDGIAKCIAELINDKALYAKINLSAREMVEKNFNISIQNTKLDEIYSSIMKE